MSDRALVATRKGLFHLEAAAGRWTIARVSFLGDAVPMVLCDPRNGAIYAALGHGHFGSKLHRSDDAGATWTEIAAPAWPEPPVGYTEPQNPMSGKAVPWRLEMIWALETGGPDQPGRLWCGTLPGGLFRSDDGGDSWTLIRSLWDRPERPAWFGGGYDYPGIHSICVDPRHSRRISLGISCGGVWRSDDDGANWRLAARGMRADFMPPGREADENVQDPHRMVQCPAAPDRFWVQHHCGIFQSSDDCANWEEIKTAPVSGFGFAVAVHPANPDIAWFVPAQKDEKRIPVEGRVVVTRTSDGGKSFDVLSRGLPQQHAYDLVFRHALDVDHSGARLLFGSTTGSLWTSDDGGDSWKSISNHLPPVYAVRFVHER